MKSDYTRAHLFLSGRVQGVGMRFYLRSLAYKHALPGFARNLPDGRVESILEGPKHQLEKMIEEIKKGEYANHIRQLQCSWESPSRSFDNFEIT